MDTRDGDAEGFGALLRAHRLAASLSQEELAARARLSAAGIAAWERGRRAPRPTTVGMLADALELSAAERTAFIAAAIRERPGGAELALSRPEPAADELSVQTPCTYPFPTPARLVGRTDELEYLERVLARGRHAGQAVLVAGTAGAGKSTLMGELVRRAQARGVVCLTGAAYEHTGVVPLGPFREALTGYLLQRPPRQARALVGAATAELAAIAPELRYHLELGDAVDGQASIGRPALLFAAVHAFLRKLSATAPVLLCVEDLHAADVASLQLFAYLVRQLSYPAQQQPLVMLGTYRPDTMATNPELANLVARFRRDHPSGMLAVQALDRTATSQLAEDVLGGPASEALIDWLHETSAGNALFAQQLALALSEQGGLVQRGGIWHEHSGKARQIPPIVRDLIAQRIGRLSPESRATLEVWAVLGPTIEFDLLAAVRNDRSEEDLLTDLAEAVDLQVLHEAPGGGYTFAHGLVREAIYAGLPRPRRELVHGKLGKLIEQRAGPRANERAAALAHHFTCAAPSTATRAKALHYNLEAGRGAAAVSSFREALTHYSAACQLLEERPDLLADDESTLVEALEGRGRAEREVGRWPECIASHQAVLAHTGDPIRRASARAMIAAVQIHMGELAGALEECSAALEELAGQTSDEAFAVRLYLQQHLARLWYFQGRFGEILKLGAEMIAAAHAAEDPLARMHAHLVTSWGHMGSGQVSPGLEHLHQALDAAQRGGNRVHVAVMLENLGLQYILAGRFDAAREQLDRALELYRESAGELRAANALHHRCRVWVATGELERARERALRMLDLELGGQDRLAADGHQILGGIDALHARWASARQRCEQALAIREQVSDRPWVVESLVELGRVHQYQGDWPRARELFERAVAVADRMEPCPFQIQAHRALGRFLLLAGDEPAAAKQLQHAVTLAQAMPDTLEYPPTLLALAELRLAQGDLLAASELGQHGLEHPEVWPVDQRVEGQLIYASIRLARGDVAAAASLAADALATAERLQAPRLMSLAALAGAQAAAETRDWPAALKGFAAAVECATRAAAPYERALAMGFYARALTATGQDPGLAAALEHQAEQLLQELVVSRPELAADAALVAAG